MENCYQRRLLDVCPTPLSSCLTVWFKHVPYAKNQSIAESDSLNPPTILEQGLHEIMSIQASYTLELKGTREGQPTKLWDLNMMAH
jgi:hypothetical protein